MVGWLVLDGWLVGVLDGSWSARLVVVVSTLLAIDRWPLCRRLAVSRSEVADCWLVGWLVGGRVCWLLVGWLVGWLVIGAWLLVIVFVDWMVVIGAWLLVIVMVG